MFKPLLAFLLLLFSSLAQAQTITVYSLSPTKGSVGTSAYIHGAHLLNAARLFFGNTPLPRGSWRNNDDYYADSNIVITIPAGLSGTHPIGVSCDTLQAHAVYSTQQLTIAQPPLPFKNAYGPTLGARYKRYSHATSVAYAYVPQGGFGQNWSFTFPVDGTDSVKYVAPPTAPLHDSFPNATIVRQRGVEFDFLQQTTTGLLNLGTTTTTYAEFETPGYLELPYGTPFNGGSSNQSLKTKGSRQRGNKFEYDDHYLGYEGDGTLTINGVTYHDVAMLRRFITEYAYDYTNTADHGPYIGSDEFYYFYEKGLSVPRLIIQAYPTQVWWVDVPQVNTLSPSTFTPVSGTAGTQVAISGRNLVAISSVFYGADRLPAAAWQVLNDSTVRLTIPANTTASAAIGVSYDSLANHATYTTTAFNLVSTPAPAGPEFDPQQGRTYALEARSASNTNFVRPATGIGQTWSYNFAAEGHDSISWIAPSAAPLAYKYPGTQYLAKWKNAPMYDHYGSSALGATELGYELPNARGQYSGGSHLIPQGLAFNATRTEHVSNTVYTGTDSSLAWQADRDITFVGTGTLVLNGISYPNQNLYKVMETSHYDGGFSETLEIYLFCEPYLGYPRLKMVSGDASYRWIVGAPGKPLGVASFLPASGPAGTQVVVKGSAFYTVQSVFYGATRLPATAWQKLTDTTLRVTIPANATTSAAIGVSYDSLASHAVYTATAFSLLRAPDLDARFNPTLGRTLVVNRANLDSTVAIQIPSMYPNTTWSYNFTPNTQQRTLTYRPPIFTDPSEYSGSQYVSKLMAGQDSTLEYLNVQDRGLISSGYKRYSRGLSTGQYFYTPGQVQIPYIPFEYSVDDGSVLTSGFRTNPSGKLFTEREILYVGHGTLILNGTHYDSLALVIIVDREYTDSTLGINDPTYKVHSAYAFLERGLGVPRLIIRTSDNRYAEFVTTPVTSFGPAAITSINPNTGHIDDTVRIRGRNFRTPVTLRFGGATALYTAVESDTIIRAAVPPGAVTGAVNGYVGGIYVSSPLPFTVIAPPVVKAYTPGAGAVGDPVLVRGTGMAQVQAVYFGTVAATITGRYGDTAVGVRVPAGAATNPIRVAITTAAAARRYSGAAYFSVLPAIPIVTSYSPTVGKVNDTVRIRGRRLSSFIAARFNGAKALYASVSGDSLVTVTIPIGSTTGPLQVQTSGNVITAGTFTILPPPTITSYSPGWGRPGDKVRVRGTGLSTASQVFLGALDAGTVYPSGDSLVTFIVPANAVSGRIKVVAATGSAQTASYFTITPYPSARIDRINPTAAAKGSFVTFTGRRFTGTSYVRFGSGAAVAAVQVVSDTQMIAKVPQNAVTGRVDAGTPYGLITSSDVFTVLNPTARSGEETTATTTNNSKLLLYPNPSPDGQATLRLPGAVEGSYTLHLYTVDGRLVQTATRTAQALDAGTHLDAALPKGTYLLRITGPATSQAVFVVE